MLKNTQIYKEIHQQPAVLRKLLTSGHAAIDRLAGLMQQRQIKHVVIAARGTSDNAGRYAQYLLGAANGILVSLATPSLFTIYGQPPEFGQALVLGISQSGKSPDIVSVLAEARRQGALTAAITNAVDSDLGGEADVVIDVQAGAERAVAATKTYTAELMAIAILSSALAEDLDRMSRLNQIPDILEATLASEPAIANLAQRYRYMRHCVVIGRGYNYATAFEIALKMKELTYTLADPYSSADFLHGPLALIEPGFPAVVVAPSGKMLPKMRDLIDSLRQRRAEILVISDDSVTLEAGDFQLPLPQTVPEWLSPIIAVVPGQILAMHLTHVKGLDPDHPRGLAKVTETR